MIKIFKKKLVTTKQQLDELYDCSALTFEGMDTDDKNINEMINWLKKYTEVIEPLPIYIILGKTMNEAYHLSGSNKYPEDLNIISIKNEYLKNFEKIVFAKFEVGGRWFDDIVNNNLSREKTKSKPKCALLGQDGNIFNLMGIASKTLKRNKMYEESKEMIEKITNSHSYDDALTIIGEYVEITDEESMEEEEVE